MTPPTVSAFKWVPPFAQGLVRDLRVRWALEEASTAYDLRLLAMGENGSEEYRHLQPFGQVPSYEEGDLVLFESGAIVLHIAEHCEGLLSIDLNTRARTISWMFAALNTVEVPVTMLNQIDRFNPATAEFRESVIEAVRRRLSSLATTLGDADYLEGGFSAADLLMVSVLRILRDTELVGEHPNLVSYQQRCEARDTFQRALGAQMATFNQNVPA
ncbi:MAG TPA: glutathione S-transferase family protein [Sphingomonas sp.]|nr:glutathione S-transferase family protein [Sphingomonas sp.]